ncbi:hypothetical protein DW322_05750 [Rhodococcus rhodnii]|uniref:Uncharacterized protein n=3 Tax=Rhodococcus rhodnii TaxID=38312 RepID=R7WSA6_9NOCA|nr:hypothetical protein Rrhod_1722 [Rhodococcus rhodnii LMG 5362]TXG89806.1 hypothetical protein DW322_05750 [Rhodococcus rhodnii]
MTARPGDRAAAHARLDEIRDELGEAEYAERRDRIAAASTLRELSRIVTHGEAADDPADQQ